MPISLGGLNISRIVHAGDDLVQVRQGGVLVWSSAQIRDDFNRENATDLGDGWTSTSSATYKIGVVDGYARCAMPDSIPAAALNTDRQYFDAAVAAFDDYQLEFRVGSMGSTDSITAVEHHTQIFARGANGTTNYGVGLDLYHSHLNILRRVNTTNTIMVTSAAGCGTFVAGDTINLNGTGDIHALYVNGKFRAQWEDTGATASKGAGYRGLHVRMDASKDLLGARRFSPTLDYIQLT